MLLDFPSSPAVDELFPDPPIEGIPQWRWDGAQWIDVAIEGGASVTVSDTAPIDPKPGDLWWDNIIGKLFLWYEDGGSGSQWVSVSSIGKAGPPGPRGPKGDPGPAGPQGLAEATISATAPSSPQEGGLWWDEKTAQLYIWTGAQWIVAINQPGGGGGGGTYDDYETTGGGQTLVLQQSPTINQPRIMGVTNASNAPSGAVGEYIQSAGGGTGVYFGTLNIMDALTLPAGDWDVGCLCTVSSRGYGDAPVIGGRVTFSFLGLYTALSSPIGQDFAPDFVHLSGIRINASTPQTLTISVGFPGTDGFNYSVNRFFHNMWARRAR